MPILNIIKPILTFLFHTGKLLLTEMTTNMKPEPKNVNNLFFCFKDLMVSINQVQV